MNNKRFIVDEEECVAAQSLTYTEYSVRDRLTGNVVSLCWDREVAQLTADALEAKAAATEGTIQA